MEFASITTPAAAFVAGLATSLHCAGMCGPLACAIVPVRRDQGDPSTVATVYHVARLAGYSALGIVAGGIGRMPLVWLSPTALRWLPWLGVLFFVGLALRWDRRLPKVPFLAGIAFRISHQFRGRPPAVAAAALGLATPLFPCGPLYFLVALATLSGSALLGAEFMLAFGLGTVPLLWLAQTQLGRLQRLSPRWTEGVRKGLALTAALVVAWRLRGTLGGAGPDPSSFICF